MADTIRHPLGRLFSAMFIVAGTCIGGGMLALPVATGSIGFLPSLAAMALCWGFMTITALLILEVTLSMEEDVHIMTMASRLLGPAGRWLAWLLFLYVSYASIVAYTSGGGVTTAGALEHVLGYTVAKPVGCFLFVLTFGLVISFGAQLVGEVNAILFVALIGAYFALLVMGGDEVKAEYLQRQSWKGWWFSVPLLLTGFSHQAFVIPTLARYLNRDAKRLRLAIIGGTTITFAVYVLWQWVVLGTVPVEGAYGLEEAFQKGDPATEYMRRAVQSPWVSAIAEFFGFFAIVTSFLGMALGLFDFLADSFHIPRWGRGRLLLAFLIIVPTFFVAIFFERAFLIAMDTSGGIGDAILNGMMPVAMVWILRSRSSTYVSYRWRGGKLLLAVVFAFYLFAFYEELRAIGLAYDPFSTVALP